MSTERDKHSQEMREALDDLIADGVIVVVQEIDPKTGKLRNRYFHRDHTPKPS